MKLYSAMYLKTPNEVVNAQRPSLMSFGMQEMLETDEVKGAATLASASERETPT